MKIYISVVSHNHFNLIKSINCLPALAKNDLFNICILDNIGEKDFQDWCSHHKLHYIKSCQTNGFGKNNNLVFDYLKSNFTIEKDDFFLILNPDVYILAEDLLHLAKISMENDASISTLNLYLNEKKTEFDFSVRNYPRALDFFSSLILRKNPSVIDKSKIKSPTFVDWAAGSFLLFNANHYERLGGFDTGYYMYCEDIDICLRSDQLLGKKVLFSPQISAVHLAHHANRSIISKHFYWHLRSVARYLKKRWFGVE